MTCYDLKDKVFPCFKSREIISQVIWKCWVGVALKLTVLKRNRDSKVGRGFLD